MIMKLQLIFVAKNELEPDIFTSLNDICFRKSIDFSQTNFDQYQESIGNKFLNQETTLLIIEILHNTEGYEFVEKLKIPPQRRKFYTAGQPLLSEVRQKYNLCFSDYIAPNSSPEIDTIFVERWIDDFLEIQDFKRRLNESAFLRHSLSSTLGETIKSLERYQETHPDFQIPNALHYISLQATLISGNLDPENINKFIFRISAEEILSTEGFCKRFIDSLTQQGQMARALAEFRLGSDKKPIFPNQLEQPDVEITGNIPFSEMNLSPGIEVYVFIAILVTLLKEAIEHTERYLRDNNPEKQEHRIIQVYTQNNDNIYIKNPCSEEVMSLTEQSNQRITIEVFSRHVSTWNIEDPQIETGFWIRRLTKEN